MQAFLGQTSGKISSLTTAGLSFAAAFLAFSPPSPDFHLLVPLAPIIGITLFIFGLGLATRESNMAALIGVFVLPLLCGVYFVLLYYVTGRGAFWGGPLAVLGLACLAATFMGKKSEA